jgi:hypothetical protein
MYRVRAACAAHAARKKGTSMRSPINLVIVVLLVLLLIGLLPAWPYSSGWGYVPSGSIGLLLIIALVMLIVLGDRGDRPLMR